METEDAEEYTQALGQVAAGAWRQIALGERLGVPGALGLSTREWVEDRLGGYVRLSIPERQEAAKELEADGHSQREIADVLGIDHRTVGRDLKPVGANAPLEPEQARPEQVEDAVAGANAPPEPQPSEAAPELSPAETEAARQEKVEQDRVWREREERSQWHGWLYQTVERLAAIDHDEASRRASEYAPETYHLPSLSKEQFEAAVDGLVRLQKELL